MQPASHHPSGPALAPGDWLAPKAPGPVRASVRPPGSKSITNRALILAALAAAPTVITAPLQARDTQLMAAALRALGAQLTEHPAAPALPGGPGTAPASPADAPVAWHVIPAPLASGAPAPAPPSAAPAPAPPGAAPPSPGATPPGAAVVDVGNAGTVLRFVPPAAALAHGDVHFRGDERASQRPVGPLLAALRSLGAVIEDGGRAAVPFTVRGRGGIDGGSVTLDASGSSQLVSGLLLSAPRFARGAQIRHAGPPVPSAPLLAMTVRMLRDAGAGVDDSASGSGQPGTDLLWRVDPGELRPGTITVEPDLPNTAPFLAAALVTGGSVTVPGWPREPLQPGAPILAMLTAMGAQCSFGPGGLTVSGSGTVHGTTADLRDLSEIVPVLTALAALADGPSQFTGIGHMRTHETDRLAALAREITALGGRITELPGGLQIRPAPLRTGRFATYDDHRLVMAAAVLGLAIPGGLAVGGAATVAKTFPGFTAAWSAMLEPGP